MTVDEIFQSVMRTFHYTSDKELFQCAEYWQTVDELEMNGGMGDCEDAAAAFVFALRKHGHTARYVLCLTETQEAHLVAETEGMILDNRHTQVMPLDRLAGYKWLACSGDTPGEPWRRIDGIA